MSNQVEKVHVLDQAGLNELIKEIFQTVENNYIRRSKHEEALNALKQKLRELEENGGIGSAYDFEINQDGHLILTVPDGANVDLSINDQGHLILNSNDTPADKNISRYRFSVTEDGNLIATV